ncbi:hypothetical protein FQA39_LY14159 [Lamprigera yunnana]|nr:hypothetical protein FQA39_LY14159 [Lamprigera yunnana]
MAGRLLSVCSKLKFRIPSGAAGLHKHEMAIIGNRDVVGHGMNGQPLYVDRGDVPMPSLRWKENTPDVLALRDKEKGDWNKLSIEEKKAIYRASFCQTFSEFKAPTGEWKSITGGVFTLMAMGIWLFILLKLFVCTPLPESFNEENRRAQFRRMLDLRVNPVTGLSSKWDYEKDDWKK